MDVRPTAPASLQVVRRSPRLLRKRGPRSCCARLRRYSKFVSLANSLHGVSSSSTVLPTPPDVLPTPAPPSVLPLRLDVLPDFSPSFSLCMSTFEAGVLMLMNLLRTWSFYRRSRVLSL